MGARKMRIRAMMDERPRLNYRIIAENSMFSLPTISRWMANEPDEYQAEIIENAIKRARSAQ